MSRHPLRERQKIQQLSVLVNLNVRALGGISATLRIHQRSQELLQQGKTIYRFGLGQSPFPVPDEVVRALKQHASRHEYLPVDGLPELRHAVVNYLHQRHHLSRNARDVLIGPGSKELMFLLMLVYYGDVVIPAPAWVSYGPQATILGRHISWIQTRKEHAWMLSPAELEQLCSMDPYRPRLVILNYPSNPAGKTFSIQELKEFARIARKYRLIILSDEIYGELHYEGRHVSIARYYPEGTIISTGLSKWCGAGGWRLGVMIFPEELRWLRDAMAIVASETYTSTSTPIQYAAVRAFEFPASVEEYLMGVRSILRGLGHYLAERLREAGIMVHTPDGGFYLFLDFEIFREALRRRGISSAEQLCEVLLEETGVALLPGSAFGRPSQELTARLSFVDFDGKKTLRAWLARAPAPDEAPDLSFLRKYCRQTLQGVETLIRWVNQLQ